MSTLSPRRRARWAAAGAVLAAMLVPVALVAAPPASSDGPTVFVQPNDITIGDGAATPYSSDLQVAGMNGVITDVRATINNITHNYPDDIQMLLVSPSGDKVELMNDTGGSTDFTGETLTFRAGGGAVPLLPNALNNAGPYLPTDDDTPDADDIFCDLSDSYPAPAPSGPYGHSMADFNGDIARGTWKLFVFDDCGGFTGSINAWRLRIVTALGNQAITFTSSSANGPVGTTRQATATGGASGQPVTFLSDTPGTCSVTGAGLISFEHVGLCTVHADQAGNADYNAAPAAHQNITVVQGSPVITFTTPNPTPVSIGDVYDADATSNFTINPVVFSVGGLTTNNACTVNNITGVTTFLNNGVCEVAANQAGNADWLPATQVSQIINVQKTAQTITITSVPPANPTIGSTYQVTATGGASGNPVTFTSNTPAVCSVTTGGLVSFLTVGNCQVQADQAGNANYAAATSVLHNIPNVKNGQVIDTSGMPVAGFKSWTVQMNASGGGGPAPVTYASTTPLVCTTTTGGLVTYVNGGTCTLKIDQAGNANYHPATQVTWNINVFGF